MSQIIDNFMDKPFGFKLGVWIASLGLIGFIFWQYFYSDFTKELSDLEDKVAKLEVEVNTEQRKAQNLKKLREVVKDLEVKLAGVLRELPDKREIPDLLNSISGLARNAGLAVVRFKPGVESFREFYAEVPIDIEVRGTYHQIATFFDEVAQLSRIVNISDIVIQKPEVDADQGVVTQTTCKATTFRYLDDAERAKINGLDASAAPTSGRSRPRPSAG